MQKLERQIPFEKGCGEDVLKALDEKETAANLCYDLGANYFDDEHPIVPAQLGNYLFNYQTRHCDRTSDEDRRYYALLNGSRERLLFILLPGMNPTRAGENLRHMFAALSENQRHEFSKLKSDDFDSWPVSTIGKRVRYVYTNNRDVLLQMLLPHNTESLEQNPCRDESDRI